MGKRVLKRKPGADRADVIPHSGGKRVLQEEPKRKRGKVVLYSILAVLLVVVIAGGVYAKYFFEKDYGTDSVRAKEFYFTSNLLTKTGVEETLSAGMDSISFTLGNHPDLLRYSADNISYEVTVTEGGAAPDPAITVTNGTGTIVNGGCNDVTVTLSNLTPGTYTVTATGKAGYQEALTATIIVPPVPMKAYKHLNTANDTHVILTVWTESVSGNAVIGFPANLIPDNTDPAMAAVYNYDGGQYKAGSFTDTGNFSGTYASHTYRFFKNNISDVFTVDQFNVTVSGTEATASTPK